MIPKDCKRLAEVDFPVATVSKHALAENGVRSEHPRGIHKWWARRPLAACRAVLLGLLLPDPCDPYCPQDFKKKARKAFEGFLGVRDGDEGLRKSLLTFIGDVADWDVANHPRWIGVARELVRAAHPEETPLVVDPFAGGGSIPLEALRLGCEAFATDLNPVACLTLRFMLEDIPRSCGEESDALKAFCAAFKKRAQEALDPYYPTEPDGTTPVAYIWARTVRCESPNCGAEIPLLKQMWLCNKENGPTALRPIVKKRRNGRELDFEIFSPATAGEVLPGTTSRAKARCLCCNVVLSPERVRAQLREQRGGGDVIFDKNGMRVGGARLVAVVDQPDNRNRQYRLPEPRDYQAVFRAHKELELLRQEKLPNGANAVPDETLPLMSGTFNVPHYGIDVWGDLYSARQKVLFATLCRLIRESNSDGSIASVALALALGKMARHCNTVSKWHRGSETVAGAFGMQAISMGWDYPEMYPFTSYAGGFEDSLESVVGPIQNLRASVRQAGQVQIADAVESPLPDGSCHLWFTDPPYYFAVPYADLSDFYFVWLKRALPGLALLRDPFDKDNPLTPKGRELCEMAHWDSARYKHKDKSFFEEGMKKAFDEGRRVLADGGIACVVFAHKTTEGWEALLSGLIRASWTITASWPIETERSARLRAREAAALATSVHLVCRPRPEDAPVGDWGEVLRELPKRVGDWMARLQGEGIRGADLVFACIGPALEIFSRYRKVETADGREVKLAEYLEKVWEVVGRTALEQVLGTAEAKARNGAAGAMEEDARLTALFLWTLQSTNGQNGSSQPAEGSAQTSGEPDEESEEYLSGTDVGETAPKVKIKGYSLVFDVVRRFAQPLGIELPKWEGRIIETKKGAVRLMAVSERAKQLFGEDGADAVADWIEHDPTRPIQQALFPEFEEEQALKIRGRGRGRRKASLDALPVESDAIREATTLDRVHAAMLLQASGQSNALRALIKAEQERGPDFLRLANALSALYPKKSEEKRLLDAMLLAVQR